MNSRHVGMLVSEAPMDSYHGGRAAALGLQKIHEAKSIKTYRQIRHWKELQTDSQSPGSLGLDAHFCSVLERQSVNQGCQAGNHQARELTSEPTTALKEKGADNHCEFFFSLYPGLFRGECNEAGRRKEPIGDIHRATGCPINSYHMQT